MNPNDYKNAVITLMVKLPGFGPGKAVQFTIDPATARALAPLPRNREIAWEFEAQRQAAEMRDQRNKLANDLANKLTAQLIDLFAKDDTINGYTREEHAAFNSPNPKS